MCCLFFEITEWKRPGAAEGLRPVRGGVG
eukprot:SAG25_NODE_1992_length_2048_cov_2.396101_1_plen_28_part_10